MKYLDYTIIYDNSDENRVYRLESEHQVCWFDNFCNAIHYIQDIWLKEHFKVGLKWRTNGTPIGHYEEILKIGEKYATTAYCYPNGMKPTETGPKKYLQKFFLRPHIGLELL